jgi:hypothetical protein
MDVDEWRRWERLINDRDVPRPDLYLVWRDATP